MISVFPAPNKSLLERALHSPDRTGKKPGIDSMSYRSLVEGRNEEAREDECEADWQLI